jgi:hypothetical protein
VCSFASQLSAISADSHRDFSGVNYEITDVGILREKTAIVVFGTHTVTAAGDVAGYCNLGDITTGPVRWHRVKERAVGPCVLIKNDTESR